MQSIEAIERSLIILRSDAIERGLSDLAVALGWSAIRLRAQRLEQVISMSDAKRQLLNAMHPISIKATQRD